MPLIKEHTTTKQLQDNYTLLFATLEGLRGSSGFKGHRSVEGPAICRMSLLPPGPAPPTLPADIQGIQLPQLPLGLPLTQQHCWSSALVHPAALLQREIWGLCAPSPVWQHTGAVLVCQGSPTV